jgi:RNA polymerase sigma-70 factor (ECF subfamily)
VADGTDILSDPDLPLVERAARGEYASFELLVKAYQQRIYAIAFRLLRNAADAEEVTQDTFVSLIEHIDTFARQSRFRAWLLRIAVNHALKRLRRRKVARETALDGEDGPLPHPEVIAPWSQDPRELAAQRETRQLLQEALDELPETYRLIFMLRDIEGLSTDEAAESLGITPGNAKVRLLRARLMLREKLTAELGDPGRRLPPHEH